MGFKKIDRDLLKTKISPNFLGIPIREGGKLIQKSHREKKIESSYAGLISEVLILNEEFIEFHYQNNGVRKSVTGNGNISIFNNSVKDRIWDANLQFSGSQFDNQKTENNLNLGIFEPNSNKVLKYEIVNSDDLPDLIDVHENIENLSEEIKTFKSNLMENESMKKGNKKKYLLLMGKENKVKFSIEIVNTSTSIIENIKFKKIFSEHFYDLEFTCNKSKEFKITRASIESALNNINPGEKAEITILANVYPKKKDNINTGNIEITFNLTTKVISGIKINHFSAYSHAMHAIKKSEKNHAPNHWQCSLIFENHSDFKLKLNSVLVFNEDKSKKILDLDLKSSGNIAINPRGKYKTDYFDSINEKEPKFSRKVEYSVEYKTERNSMISSRFDDSFFTVASIAIKKKLSDEAIKSFEETLLSSKIIIKNQGSAPIKGLKIIERVPEDFLPSRNISDYTLYRSSGKLDIKEIELKLEPDDEDPSHEHTLELKINLKNNDLKSVIEVEDFLELKYPLKAITPDYKKAYEFPLFVSTFYPKYENSEIKEFYMITNDLSDMEKSAISISHKRRKVMVGKQIYPGRSANEFAIYIIAKNGSSMKITDVDITDAFPDSFELISSNTEHKLSKSNKNGEHNISFTIETLQPYQEREIMYYLKSLSGKDVKYSELESYFVG
ncbi:MAG: hypothetical protein V3V33_01535 [Candidatus Lokiarchaeia archaeon]